MAQVMPDNQYATALLLQEPTRAALWRRVMEAIEGYLSDVTNLPITANFDSQQVRSSIEGINFDNPLTPLQAVEFALTTLRQHQTHADTNVESGARKNLYNISITCRFDNKKRKEKTNV